jgi:outer membrane protein assembly factor BamB
LACFVLVACTRSAEAQRNPAVSPAPNVVLDANSAAAKMIGAARDFLAARQWGDAIDLLRQTADQHGDRLVPLEPGRYVKAQTGVDILLSSLPPEAIKLYRAKVDSQARRWFEAAKKQRDPEGLERIVRKAFLSSVADDALLLLGDIAWEQGALSRARGYWEKLASPLAPVDAGTAPLVLRYPDSDLDPALVQARLVLCRLYEGDAERAHALLARFRRDYPEAQGVLGGRNGNLGALLTQLLDASQARGGDKELVATTTFAGNFERNLLQPREFDVGAPVWSARLKELPPEVRMFLNEDQPGDPRIERRFVARQPERVPAFFPVVWKNVVFYCDETDVYAIDTTPARAGQPAWGAEASIYHHPREPARLPRISAPRVGFPRFTLALDGEFLYARLGMATVPSSRRRDFRQGGDVLVCLGLGREGDLQWVVNSDDMGSEPGRWTFDGAPVAAGGRVFAAMRRGDPNVELHVACFDGTTGKLLWNRKICGGFEPLGGDVDEVRHQLLTLAENRLYYCTNQGAVAALDSVDGALQWVATYPRVEADTIEAYNKRQRLGPNPCVVSGGMVFAAPTDCEGILAIDADTGIRKWAHFVHGNVPQLLGVAKSRLIAAGDSLWALETETGRVDWRDERGDPEAATWGRGLIAGDRIYWARREEIRIVDIATGIPIRQIDLAQQFGLYGGGNLAIGGGTLLLAQTNRLVAFQEFGARPAPLDKPLAAVARDPKRGFALDPNIAERGPRTKAERRKPRHVVK